MNVFGASPSEVEKLMMAEKTQRIQACRRRNQFFKEYDKLYYLQHYGQRSPGSYKGKKGIEAQANDATTQVNIMRQLIGIKDLRIKVLPRWITEEELEAGSEMERWIWAVLEANNDRQEADILDLILFDAIRLGWATAYSSWDQELATQSTVPLPMEQYGQEPWAQGVSPIPMPPQMGGGLSPEMAGGLSPEMGVSPQAGSSPEMGLLAEMASLPGMGGGLSPGIGMSPEMGLSPGMGLPPGGEQQWGIPLITECPIVIQRISPYFVYPEPGGHQGRWRSFLIIEDKKNAMEVAQEWDVMPKKLREARIGEKHRITVQYIVYWGWEKIEGHWYVVNCVMADDEIIRPPVIMEGYDALPITLFFCHPTGDSRWEYMSLSALFPIHLDVKLLDHLMSRLHKQVDIYTDLPLLHAKPKTGQGSQIKVDRGIYNVLDLEPGEGLEFAQWPGNAPDFYALLNLERQKIQEGGFSSLAMGETIPVSGIAASRLWESNVIKLVEPTKAYTRGLKSLLNKVKSLATNFAPQTPISLITNYPKATGNVILKGEDLAPYLVSPELTGELPMDQFRRLALGLQFSQLPPELRPFSDETLMERFLDVDQPEEEFAKKLLDMARQSKTIRLLQTWQYLTSQGYNIDINLLAQLEGAVGGAPPGQQGLPSQQAPPRQAVSTAMSPYEPGTSTLMEEQFQGQPPQQTKPGFLRGAAAPPGGFGGRQRQ